MIDQKETSTARVRKSIRNLRNRGGKMVTVALQPPATVHLTTLQKHFKNRKGQTEIINLAIEKMAKDIKDSYMKIKKGR